MRTFLFNLRHDLQVMEVSTLLCGYLRLAVAMWLYGRCDGVVHVLFNTHFAHDSLDLHRQFLLYSVTTRDRCFPSVLLTKGLVRPHRVIPVPGVYCLCGYHRDKTQSPVKMYRRSTLRNYGPL